MEYLDAGLLGREAKAVPAGKRRRLLSLDITRGATVAGMILVNNGYGDGTLPMLLHATWNGLSLSDFVFPFFLFIMGVSIYLSLSKGGFRFRKSAVCKVCKRTILLIAIGLAINALGQAAWGGFVWSDFRFMAVLQRIALCYFLVAIFALCGKPRLTLPLAAALLAGYTVLLMLGNGYSEVPSDNILWRVDAWALGESHLYQWMPIDPEGILGTMSSMVNTLLGFYCAQLFSKSQNVKDKVMEVFTFGTLLLFAGFVIHYFLPYNKNIWSPSFALTTSGACALLLALTMRVADTGNCEQRNSWQRFLLVFGSNALFLYVSSEVMAIIFGATGLNEWWYALILTALPIPWISSLLYALTYVALNWWLGYLLWKRGIFIKL